MARTAETTSTTLAADAPAALVAWPKTIDVPLSGPKRQNSPEKGRARSTHGAGGRQTHGQTLPTPSHLGSKSQPRTGHTREPDPTPCSLAHRSSSRAGQRPLPSSAWISFALMYSRLPEKGTKLVTWGAAMIKKKRVWISG